MLNIQVPEILTDHKQLTTTDISFVYYNEYTPVGRNLISFSKYAVSFILSGQKELYRGAECMAFGELDAVLIPNGNAIIAERKLNAEKYSSLVVFFAPKLAEEFLIKWRSKNKAASKAASVTYPPFLKFYQTPYIKEYMNALINLIEMQVPVQEILLLHKLEELFLILMEKFPAEFCHIFKQSGEDKGNKLRQIVENNILNNLTISELAFLSNSSLAKFKRDFEKEYGVSPGKYIRDRKLDIAMHSIGEGKSLSDITTQLGYENVSNFILAFKRKFGKTPHIYKSSLEI
jgi:AraC-like DNA-binding protein